MKTHNWIVVEIDGGPVGIGDFWKCKDCGASGGPVGAFHPHSEPFYAGTGMKLSEDCAISKLMIKCFEDGYQYCLDRVPPKIQKKFLLKR